MIPAEAKFAVSEEELPHVSGRLNVLTLKYGLTTTEYLLYGTSSAGAASVRRPSPTVTSSRSPGGRACLLKRK